MDHVAQATRWVWPFADGSKDMRDLLGGKGANVAEMTRILGARQGAGGLHHHHGGVRGLHGGRPRAARRTADQVAAALADLEAQGGQELGDPQDPLLVSVRSGAASRCRGCSTRS
jgi:pyruvate,orthophosphate dikinase